MKFVAALGRQSDAIHFVVCFVAVRMLVRLLSPWSAVAATVAKDSHDAHSYTGSYWLSLLGKWSTALIFTALALLLAHTWIRSRLGTSDTEVDGDTSTQSDSRISMRASSHAGAMVGRKDSKLSEERQSILKP